MIKKLKLGFCHSWPYSTSELIKKRADNTKPHMGLTCWENGPEGKIIKTDVSIAKNYLTRDELNSLGKIVNAYLELAEDRAKRHIPMTMEDWAKRLDKFLEFDEREILQNAGSISAKIAKDHQKANLKDIASSKIDYLSLTLIKKFRNLSSRLPG